jgi:hypothetical protein
MVRSSLQVELIQDLDAVAITTPDGAEHVVPHVAFAERWADGRYPARCGAWVTSASMFDPPGKPCELCRCTPAPRMRTPATEADYG